MKDAFTLKRDEYLLNELIEHHEHRRALRHISIHPSATFHKTMKLLPSLAIARASLLAEKASLIAGYKSGPKQFARRHVVTVANLATRARSGDEYYTGWL